MCRTVFRIMNQNGTMSDWEGHKCLLDDLSVYAGALFRITNQTGEMGGWKGCK